MEEERQTLSNSNYVTPSQISQLQETTNSLTKLLMEISNYLINLRREFRGEALYQDESGKNHWIQISKPTFVKMDILFKKPIKEKINMPWGEEKEVYVANDEAIDEVISMLKFMGINQINPIGFNTSDNYLDDLLEFECKLAAVLNLKQKEWGLDKELLPMIMSKIKTIVQDARSLSVNGKVLHALQTTVQRTEQAVEGLNKKSFAEKTSPYQ